MITIVYRDFKCGSRDDFETELGLTEQILIHSYIQCFIEYRIWAGHPALR